MDQEKYKKLLLVEKIQIEKSLSERGHTTKSGDWIADEAPIDESDFDLTSTANRIEEYEGNVGVLSSLESHLADVMSALAKIEDGTYGACEKGGEKIDIARLDANPSARTCQMHMNED